MTRPRPRPILEHCEGRDQDDRAALWVAWRRVRDVIGPAATNLHVRELLFIIHALDRTGEGCQLTHAEIADRLETTTDTARRVIRRAESTGLLVVRQQRYRSGGQTANRYSIDRQAVLQLGHATPHRVVASVTPGTDHPDAITPAASPGGVPAHPPVPIAHPPVPIAHPIEEPSRPYSRHPSRHSLPPRIEATAPATDPGAWVVVVSDLVSLGMSADGSSAAVTAAQTRGLTAADVATLVDRYRSTAAADPRVTVGWLHRWITGRSSPPEPKTARPIAPSTLSTAQARHLARERLRARIMRSGREAGIAPEVIDRRIQEALAAFDAKHSTPNP